MNFCGFDRLAALGCEGPAREPSVIGCSLQYSWSRCLGLFSAPECFDCSLRSTLRERQQRRSLLHIPSRQQHRPPLARASSPSHPHCQTRASPHHHSPELTLPLRICESTTPASPDIPPSPNFSPSPHKPPHSRSLYPSSTNTNHQSIAHKPLLCFPKAQRHSLFQSIASR